MLLAALVQNMRPMLLEDRLWTFSALRVSNCILRKTNANLRLENRTMQTPNHRTYDKVGETMKLARREPSKLAFSSS